MSNSILKRQLAEFENSFAKPNQRKNEIEPKKKKNKKQKAKQQNNGLSLISNYNAFSKSLECCLNSHPC